MIRCGKGKARTIGNMSALVAAEQESDIFPVAGEGAIFMNIPSPDEETVCEMASSIRMADARVLHLRGPT